MSDIAIGLSIIGLVLLVLILLGHGLWVFLAFVFRGFQPKKTPRQICGFCGRQTQLDANECHCCGKEQNSPLAAELRDLDAVKRQLRRFQANGDLKPETVANLLERVKQYRERLLHPAAMPQPVANVPPVVQPPPTAKSAQAVKPAPAAPVLVAAEVVEEPRRPIEQILAKPQAAEIVAKPHATPAKFQPTPAAPKLQPPPLPPPPPRKSLGEVVASFLQERDIHWTELMGVLLGGLLMVGASVMFVIAYWSRLESAQWLKFSIFVGYSSVVFAAGLFVFHRWKLQATGRGLMTIGILLAPLNFLAMASSPASLAMTALELLALGVFAWLVALAAKALTHGGQWPMTAAVIGNSVLILLAGQFSGSVASPVAWMSYGLVAAGLFAAAAAWHFRQAGGEIPSVAGKGEKKVENSETAEKERSNAVLPAANSLFMLLGVAAYCTALSFGLIATQAWQTNGKNLPLALHLLASPLCLAAIPVLGIGLFLHRRIPRAANLEGHRTVATTIALVGVALQLAALVLAWPQPLLLAAVGLLVAGCLAYLAVRPIFPLLMRVRLSARQSPIWPCFTSSSINNCAAGKATP